MNWLITGGCGFIGTSLIRQILIQNPADGIRVVDNLDIGTPEDLAAVAPAYVSVTAEGIVAAPQSVELLIADVREAEAMALAAKGCDIIVHLAAHTGVLPSIANPRHDMSVNVIGTFNILEAARVNAVGKVIMASSGAALGKAEQPVNETRLPRPSSPYGAGKAATEMYANAYYHSFGIETNVLRFSNVYGPRSKHKGSVIAKFIKQAIAGENLTIYGAGAQLRDYIYIDDLVEAIFATAASSMGGEVYQIATQIETPVQDIALAVQKSYSDTTGKHVEIISLPALKGDEDRVTADISKARKQLGFCPKVGLEQGVAETMRYFMSL